MIRLQRWIFVLVFAAASLLTCAAQDTVNSASQWTPLNSAPQISVVRGVPFSAQITTESVHVLADGNRIVGKTTASIARDSDGRTWRQQGVPATADHAGATVVFITDPVGGLAYVVDPRARVMRKMTLSPAPATTDSAEVKRGPNVKSESLGTQVVDGLVTEGTRLTRAIAVGSAGNERALEVVTETWFSPDLQIVVINKTTDPRLGETLYKVTDIKRVEPDRSVFEIPSDYREDKGKSK